MMTAFAVPLRVAARVIVEGRNADAAVAPRPTRRKDRRSISMPRHELGRIQQGPKDVLVRLGAVAFCPHSLNERGGFLRRRRTRNRAKKELLDPLRRVLLAREDAAEREGRRRGRRAPGVLAVQEPERLGDRRLRASRGGDVVPQERRSEFVKEGVARMDRSALRSAAARRLIDARREKDGVEEV